MGKGSSTNYTSCMHIYMERGPRRLVANGDQNERREHFSTV